MTYDVLVFCQQFIKTDFCSHQINILIHAWLHVQTSNKWNNLDRFLASAFLRVLLGFCLIKTALWVFSALVSFLVCGSLSLCFALKYELYLTQLHHSTYNNVLRHDVFSVVSHWKKKCLYYFAIANLDEHLSFNLMLAC